PCGQETRSAALGSDKTRSIGVGFSIRAGASLAHSRGMHRWEPRVTFRRRIVKQGNSLPVWIWKSAGFFALLVGLRAWSQEASPTSAQQTESLTTAVHELQDQVRELRAAVVEVRSEAAQYRAETAELRKELQVTRSQLVSSGAPSQPNSYAGPSSAPANSRAGEESAKSVGTVEDRVDALEET